MNPSKCKLIVLLFVAVTILFSGSIVCMAAAASTVSFGGAPWGVAYDSGKGELWVVDSGAGMVKALSDSNYDVLHTVNVGQTPYRDIYDAGTGEIFVANYGDNTVSVISDQLNKVIVTIPVGPSPSSFAYDSALGEVFVANSGANTVSVISDANNTVVATITVGNNPYDLCYDPAKGEIFVANSHSRSMSVISDSNNSVVATIAVGSGPLGAAYDSSTGQVFVANMVSGSVSVISDSNNSVVTSVTVGSEPGAVVYNPVKGEIFVLNRNSGSVSVISDVNDTVVSTIAVGSKPYAADYDSSRGEVVIADYGSGTLSVIPDSPASAQFSLPIALPKVWVPTPVDMAASVAVSTVIMAAISSIFSSTRGSSKSIWSSFTEKMRDAVPDNIKDWFGELVSSKTEEVVVERVGSVFLPTATEMVAYVVSVLVLALSFAYAKVATFDEVWGLLPVYLATSVLVSFVQEYVSIVYLRRRGVWSEERIWPLGLVLYGITTVAFKAPFSAPARSASAEKNSEKITADASALGVWVGLAFAGLFFLIALAGFSLIGGAGLSMCVIMSLVGILPIPPMGGRDIYNHDRRRWMRLLLLTTVVFVAWLLLL